MLIRRKMQATVVVTLLLAIGTGYLLFNAFQRTSEIMVIQTRIGMVNRGVANLEVLSHEFWINRSKRASRQWYSQYDLMLKEIDNLIKHEQLSSMLQQVRENLQSSRKVFEQLGIEFEEKSGFKQNFQQQFVTEQLASQLLALFQGLMDDMELLTTHTKEELTQDIKNLGLILGGVLVLFVIVVLGMAFVVFKNVITPLTLLKEGTKRISRMELDYRIAHKDRDEVDDIAASFNTMAESLHKTEIERKDAGWVRDCLLGLDEAVRSIEGSATIAERILNYITNVLDLPVAILYLGDGKGRYRYVAGRSWDKKQCHQSEFTEGEGLPGQAVAANKIIEIDDLPERYLEVVSGQTHLELKRLLLVPFSFAGQVIAVLELGLTGPLKPIQMEFLKLAAEKAAVILLGQVHLDVVQEVVSK